MQCNDTGREVPRFNELDSALNELGMLATRTNSTCQFLHELEQKKRNYMNLMTAINTRYVSNVSIGFQLRPGAPVVRYKPYRPRPRTKSENNDANADSASIAKTVVDSCVDKSLEEINQLKKSKSLESILVENNSNVNSKNINSDTSKEIEVVSNSIQNLKVAE